MGGWKYINHVLVQVSVFVLAANAKLQVQQSPTPVQETQVCFPRELRSTPFLLGVNVPWHFYGWDFDSHYLWGTAFNVSFWNKTFAEIRQAGGDTARIFVFCDGRASPQFDERTGDVLPLTSQFFSRMDAVVTQAKIHNIKLVLVLWNFDALHDNRNCCGKYAGLHLDMFMKPTKFFNNVLKPLVRHYKNETAVYAWELMNEPEFAMTGTGKGYTTQLVPLHVMMKFMIDCTRIIHSLSPGKKVTIGGAHPDTIHMWTDESLMTYGSGRTGLLDFLQVHVYPWSEKIEDVKMWMQTYHKPVLIGETPPRVGPYSSLKQLVDVYSSNGMGVLYWAYYSGDQVLGNWTDMKPLISDFNKVFPRAVLP